MKKTISIVLSLYNEEQGIPGFWLALNEELEKLSSVNFELIWVNDGSVDRTQLFINDILSRNTENHIAHCSIEFSRNFGHEAAMIAGIDRSNGEAVICMDSDGQHPPAEISKMIDSFSSGKDLVLMERIERADNGLLKTFLSSSFYRIINRLSSVKFQRNTTDFFLISRQVAEHLKSNYREQSRFIRGYLQDIGFTVEILPFHAPCRLCGESKYSYLKLFAHALNAVFAFSNKPLRISMYCSGIFLMFTFLFGLYTFYMYLYGDSPPSGYTSIILLLLISFSMLFLVITVLSLYFEKAIKEMRQRPIYIVRDVKYSSVKRKRRSLSSVTKSVLKKNSIEKGAQKMAHNY